VLDAITTLSQFRLFFCGKVTNYINDGRRVKVITYLITKPVYATVGGYTDEVLTSLSGAPSSHAH